METNDKSYMNHGLDSVLGANPYRSYQFEYSKVNSEFSNNHMEDFMEEPNMNSHCSPLNLIEEAAEEEYWGLANTCAHPEYLQEE